MPVLYLLCLYCDYYVCTMPNCNHPGAVAKKTKSCDKPIGNKITELVLVDSSLHRISVHDVLRCQPSLTQNLTLVLVLI